METYYCNCIFLKEDLRKKGFRISKGHKFGSNRGNFRPGQGRGNNRNKNGFGNKNQPRGRGRPDQLNCMNDDMGYDEDQMTEEELFMVYISEFKEATGCEIQYEEELNNQWILYASKAILILTMSKFRIPVLNRISSVN